MQVCVVAGVITAAGLGWAVVAGDSYTASVRVTVQAGDDATRAGDPARLARNEVELLRDPGLVRGIVPAARAQPAGLLARWHRAVQAGLSALAAQVGASWGADTGAGKAADRTEQGEAAFTARVARALRVRQAGDTDVLTVSFTWDDPLAAADALEAVMARYRTARSDGGEAREAARRLSVRLSDAQGELAAIDARMTGGTEADALKGERARLEGRLDEQRAASGKAMLARDLTQRRIDGVDQAHASGGWVDTADTSDGAGGPAPLAGGFAALLDKRSALLAAGRGDSAEMRALNRETARVREQTYAAVRQVLAGRLAGLDDRLSALKAAIADQEAALLTLDRHVSEAEVLEREHAAAAARVADAARALDSARLRVGAAWQGAAGPGIAGPGSLGAGGLGAGGLGAESLGAGSLGTGSLGTGGRGAGGLGAGSLGTVTLPAGPDWPSSGAIVGMASVLGLAAGVWSAAWAEARRSIILRRVDVSRHLGLEVLACLEDLTLVRLR